MFENDLNKETYEYLMDLLKTQNKEYVEYIKKDPRFRIKQLRTELRNGKFKYAFVSGIRYLSGKSLKRQLTNEKHNECVADYFCSKKIAIYTCITGNYEALREPVFIPDNCDFFVVTDMEVKNSAWQVIDINQIEGLDNLSDREKNRYIKMHPEILFPEYTYSIYLDGNVKPISDLTEFVNMLPQCGIAVFKHTTTDCVYKEAGNVLRSKKASKAEIREHTDFLRNEKMPNNYGMASCGFIVREHNNPLCIKIMNEWWEQYRKHSKRDQMSFPYVLYKNNIKMDDVAVLKDGLYTNYALRVLPHFMKD